jgi:osmotically inducible protein OsmC
MAMAERSANGAWDGDLAHGAGTVTGASGALGDLPVTWASRTQRSEGKTSPEELVAAAHAACFSVALANILSQAGHTPDRISTAARVTLRNIDGAPTLARVDLETICQVPGLDLDGLQRHADQAAKDCPVSRALAGIPEIVVSARLA